MPRVTFHENEVSCVQTYQRLDNQHVQELFYQSEDFIRFRAEYKLFKAEEARLNRLYRMSQLERKQQLVKMSVIPAFERQYQYRRPVQTRECALMA